MMYFPPVMAPGSIALALPPSNPALVGTTGYFQSLQFGSLLAISTPVVVTIP